MKDITQELITAINQDVIWSIGLFYDLVEELRNKIEVSYWDGEENWATLIIHGNPMGYLWKKYPVVIIESNYSEVLHLSFNGYSYLSVIFVDDLNTESLKLDYKILSDYLEYGIDYEKFSATDLWFQTNSI